MVPFVLQLLGEYVVEILRLLHTNVAVLRGEDYARFAAQNPRFVERTKSRIVRYWDCYNRREYPRLVEYPGFLVAEALDWWKPRDVPRVRAR